MGETYRTFWSDGFPRTTIGILTGTAAYQQFPNLPGKVFRLQGKASNIGSFFIGEFTGSKAGFGVGAQIAWEIDAGYDTEFFNVAGDNLNSLYFYNSSGSSERLSYWIQG